VDAKRTNIVQKLLAKAERAGTPEESETFYAKAQELMVKWSIDEAMLRSAKKTDEKVVSRSITINKSGQWKANVRLVNRIADANGVKSVYSAPIGAGSKPVVHLVGFESDIANVELLYNSMLIQSSRFRRLMMPEHIKNDSKNRLPWVRSFIEAFAERIGDRLMENKKMAEATYGQETYGNSLALVLVSKEDQVKAEFARKFPKLRYTQSRSKMNWDGIMAGLEAGNQADLGSSQIGGKREIGQ
jgi:hypothetical protein